MKVVDVLALVGCITGVAGLLMHFYRFLLERPSLKIETPVSLNSYFFKAASDITETYRTKYCCVISIKVSNCSSYPVSIDSVNVQKYKSKIRFPHVPDFKFRPIEVRVSKNSSTYYEPKPSMVLPLRIEPFDTVFTSIRLPFFDEYLNSETPDKPVTVTLFLCTPRMVFSHRVKIYELQQHHESRRPKKD